MPTPSRTRPPREDVGLGGLLRDQRRLALREDEHGGDGLDAAGCGGEKPEQDERLVKRGVLVVSAAPAAGSLRIRTEHVIVDQHVGCTEGFGTLGKRLDGAGIGAYLVVRKYNAVFHCGFGLIADDFQWRQSQRFAIRIVIVMQCRFVAPERHVFLCAGQCANM